MIKGLKKFFFRMMAGANIATIILMLLVGNADLLSPVEHPVLANAGLVFPVFLLLNLLFLFFWLTFHWKGMFIPVIGYLLCFPSIRIYMPLNPQSEPPEDAIKVMTYNVCRFGKNASPDEDNAILSYIRESQADIVCLQEAGSTRITQDEVESRLKDLYQYCDTAVRYYSGNTMAVFSKYPIVGKEHIKFDSKWNLSAAFKLLIDGDTVIIVNNHLESNLLMNKEQEQFKELVKGQGNQQTRKETSHMLIDRLAEAVVIRQPEALAVAEYVRMHEGKSMLVCGDFNDNPLSFSRRTVADGLTDCFVTAGRGFGWSFNKSGMYVRIDNLFCTNDWEPFQCKTDSKIKASDHYPLICWLKKRPKH